MKKPLFALIASLSLASTAFAQTTVTQPWVRATVPQQTASGAFMQLRSADSAKLVSATSPIAASVQIHKMEMTGQMMKMREVDAIDLPAGETVNLASGGFHIMLVGLKRQLKEGETVPLSLVIERKNGKRETVAVDAPVKPLTYAAPQGAAPTHH
jgi:copper(I)-binding protein